MFLEHLTPLHIQAMKTSDLYVNAPLHHSPETQLTLITRVEAKGNIRGGINGMSSIHALFLERGHFQQFHCSFFLLCYKHIGIFLE